MKLALTLKLSAKKYDKIIKKCKNDYFGMFCEQPVILTFPQLYERTNNHLAVVKNHQLSTCDTDDKMEEIYCNDFRE